MHQYVRALCAVMVVIALAACSQETDISNPTSGSSALGPANSLPELGTKKGEIGDRVWIDGNCDGVQNEGEKGFDGVTVTLTDCQGNVIDTQVTANGGLYLFTTLDPGDYRVCFDLPEGYEFTTANVGDDATDSDALTDGCTDCFTLGEDESNRTVDAGLCRKKDDTGEESCTPGYWKTKPTEAVWGPTGYHWDDSFNEVFGCDLFDADFTLLQALWQGGGGVKKLGRHGTAALLNAAHPLVDYPLTVQEVIDAVCNDGAGNYLAGLNEDFPCPINAHGEEEGGDDGDGGDGGDKPTAKRFDNGR